MKQWVISFLLLLAACQNKVVHNHQIALVAPLTGPLSYWGKTCEQAVRLAFKNSHFKLLVFDNKGEVKKTKSIFLRLAKEQNVIAAIGPLQCKCFEEIIHIVKKAYLPVISLGCFKNFFSFTQGWIIPVFPWQEEIKLVAEYINKKNGNWAILLEDSPWTQIIADYLQKMVSKTPIFIRKISPLDLTPFSKRPNLIVLIANPEIAGLAVFKTEKIAVNTTFLGLHFLLDPSFFSLASNKQKILIATPILSGKIQKEFENAFLKHYYKMPPWIAICAYAAANEISKLQKSSRKEMKKFLNKHKFPIKFCLKEIKQCSKKK